MKSSLFTLVTAGSIAVAGLACTKQQAVTAAPAVPYAGSCVAKVLEDALAGMTRQAILEDLTSQSCVATIAEVDTILAGDGPVSPAITRTAAYEEMSNARRVQLP